MAYEMRECVIDGLPPPHPMAAYTPSGGYIGDESFAKQLEEMGIADEIYNNPQQEYTKKLIAAIPKGNLADIKARFERV